MQWTFHIFLKQIYLTYHWKSDKKFNEKKTLNYFYMMDIPEVVLWYGVISGVVELVFYGPSTLLWPFWARSVNLYTLFLGKPPRQFTST